MNVFKIFFGKRNEKLPRPVADDNGNKAAEPCSDDGKSNAEPVDEEKDSTETDEVGETDINTGYSSADDNKCDSIPDDIQNVYHLVVVDESGSMQRIARQTVDGCNETISHIKLLQKKSEGIQKHYLSLYFFMGGNMRYARKNQPIDRVDLITEKDYTPCSNTPLYDALGHTLNDLERVMNKDSGNPLGYVTVITDGYENSSHRFGLYDVRRIISRMKENGVVFSFIGANIDVDKVASDLNIGNATQFNQTDEGTRNMWRDEIRSKERYIAKSMYFDFCRSTGVENPDISEKEWRRRENAGGLKLKYKVDRSKVSPSFVPSLNDDEYFVFFTDIHGHHDSSSGKLAVDLFGAKLGQAEGLQGHSYAIPIDYSTAKEPNDPRKIFKSVHRFTQFAREHPEMKFIVWYYDTEKAAIDRMQLASMFLGASKLNNVKLPEVFCDLAF